jgi:cytochrome c oxidase subunit 3
MAPAAQAATDELPTEQEASRGAFTASFGMWTFLASEVLFFGGLIVAYAAMRFQWPEGFAAASRETHVVLGTVNTALLLTSSALVALAASHEEEADFERHRARIAWLLAGACALGLAFIAIKGVEYRKEWLEHLVPGAHFKLRGTTGAELFFMLYFVTTGLHAVHLTIGVVVLGVFAWAAHRGKAWVMPRRVEAAGLYWHFVDVVWIFLYPLIYLAGRAT